MQLYSTAVVAYTSTTSSEEQNLVAIHRYSSTKFSTFESTIYCILDHEEIGAWRPRGAHARDFVKFRKKFMHRAHGKPSAKNIRILNIDNFGKIC